MIINNVNTTTSSIVTFQYFGNTVFSVSNSGTVSGTAVFSLPTLSLNQVYINVKIVVSFGFTTYEANVSKFLPCLLGGLL